MFKKWIVVSTVIVVLLTSLVLAGCQGNSTGILSPNQQTGIWVSGDGKVSVTPDIATVQVGVSVQATTVAGAQSQANKSMKAVMDALTTNGVAEKDIQTSYFNVQSVTQWNQDLQKNEDIGYQVTNLVTAKIRNVGNAGIVIDAVVTAGGNDIQINSITFSVDDPTTYYVQARQQAITKAKSTAENMAQAAGVTLGRLQFITETDSSGTTPPIYYSKATADAATSTPISSGSIDVTVTVQMSYAIK